MLPPSQMALLWEKPAPEKLNFYNVIHSPPKNVPVDTAADWASEVVKFCKGEAEMTEESFLRCLII